MAILELTAEQVFQLAQQLTAEERQQLAAKLSVASNRPSAEETSVSKGKRKPGGYEGKIWMADDFNAPLPDEIQVLFDL